MKFVIEDGIAFKGSGQTLDKKAKKELKISGYVENNYEETQWKGFYVQNGKAEAMEIPNLKIDEEGNITGSASDVAGESTFYGKMDTDEKNVDEDLLLDIEFEKKYPEWTIYYHGKINLLRSKVKGHWGFQKGGKDATFELEMIDDSQAKIFIETGSGEEMFGGEITCLLDHEKFMFHSPKLPEKDEDEDEDGEGSSPNNDDSIARTMKLSSLELTEHSILHYQINSNNVQFSEFNKQGVIIAEFIAKAVPDNDHYAKGYAQCTQMLYKVE